MSTRFLQNFSDPTQILANDGHTGVGAVDGVPYFNPGGGARPIPAFFGLKQPYFVNTTVGIGSDSNSGRTWTKPFLTMAKAFSVVESGGMIRFVGKVQEQLTCPVGVFDVTVSGEGARPRHQDASPVGANLSGSMWTTRATPAATTPLVTVIQQGWRFVNILFAGPTTAACVLLTRTAEGAAETDASHAAIIGCRFASGYDGINDTGGCYGVLVQSCRFLALTNYAIHGVGNIGVGQTEWQILDCKFAGNTFGVKIEGFSCLISGCAFDDGSNPGTAVVLDTYSTSGVNNHVTNNSFQTTTGNFNSPDIIGSSTDVWYNYSITGLEVGVPA